LRAEDDIDTMTEFELAFLEKELGQNLELRSKFHSNKTKINGKDCVLYARIKDIILEQLYASGKID
jgi:hypothetical protein